MGSSLFGKSEYMTRSDAKTRLEEIVRSLIRPDTSDRVILVGQSVDSDIFQLENDATFRMKLETLIGENFQILDTHRLSLQARKEGAKFQGSMRLASIALNLGIEEKYRIRRLATSKEAARESLYSSAPLVFDDLKACHNASNDAAYALITMLLFALRWSDFVVNGTARGRLAAKVWDKTGHITSSEVAKKFISELPAIERFHLSSMPQLEDTRMKEEAARTLYEQVRAEKAERKIKKSWYGRLKSMFRG